MKNIQEDIVEYGPASKSFSSEAPQSDSGTASETVYRALTTENGWNGLLHNEVKVICADSGLSAANYGPNPMLQMH